MKNKITLVKTLIYAQILVITFFLISCNNTVRDQGRKSTNSQYETSEKMHAELVTDNLRDENIQDTIYPLEIKNIPNKIKASTEGCTDCFWYDFNNGFETGNLLFVHDPNEDKLFFNFESVIYNIPLKSREFKEGTTETGMPNGTGTLVFESDELKLVLDYSQAGFGFGSVGLLTIFKWGKKIKTLNIRCNF